MKTLTIGSLTLLLALASAGPLLAHHSLVNFDTTKPIRIKGKVVRIHEMNPHSFIYVEEVAADGQVRRWAAEGPAVRQLARLGFDVTSVKVGDVVEICGYLPKEPIVWQVANPDPQATSVSGRLINGEMLVTSDGREQSWGDYGVHLCFAPGYRDQHSK